jgi:hypothetical protein
MTYELRRLRLHGLIQRLLGTNIYIPTPDGVRMALSFTKVHDRLLGPLLAADHPPGPSCGSARGTGRRPSRGRLHHPKQPMTAMPARVAYRPVSR